jgi:hypothetical protein
MTSHPAALGGRHPRAGSVVAWALLALMVGLLTVILQPPLPPDPIGPKAVPSDGAAAQALMNAPPLARHEAPAEAEPVAQPGQPSAALPMAPQARSPAAQPGDEWHYRFLGRTESSGASVIVLFGRGRVVTLNGVGPLDAEYMVEALSDQHVLLRHLPSGKGHFLPLTVPGRSLGSPRDPEDLPRD